MRVRVHVHPGATRARVGGSYDGALSVHVRARAREGAASAEVLEALARAFDLSRADVHLVRGARSRTKLVELRGDDDTLDARLRVLLQTSTD
jgi:uncharacterized protein (TIGR00251 family)